ncbi:SMP-30/gluconolactonase/LRE family protein [Ramlibacter sp.]|uniref:SMP-30/gluconolactonase/LRE family protein n=1 Tax=Ramlibacter sp. TaxID=1917967 RepID=UPI003D0D26EB
MKIVEADNLLGEGPQWNAARQELVWIDGSKPHLWRWRAGAARAEPWPLQRPPAAVLPLDDGRLVIAFRAGIAIAESFGAAIRPLELPGLDLGDERFNDAKVDARGRLWIGTLDRRLTRPIGRLYRIDDASVAAMDSGFALSNGIAWSPDASTMYFSESMDRVVHRYAFDVESGGIRRLDPLMRVEGPPAKTDGLTVDAEGGIWCAIFGGRRIERRRPDGALDRTIELPVTNPTSCTFGGADLRTLFVTTARYGLAPDALSREPHAGCLLALDAGVQGIAEPQLASTNLLLAQPAARIHPPESAHA